MTESKAEWLTAENARLTQQVESLLRELHAANKAKQYHMNIAQQCTQRYKELLDELQTGERGKACTAIEEATYNES